MPKLNLVPNKHNMPLVEVRINKMPHLFLVDTGASHSVFSPALVENTAIKPIGMNEAMGASGRAISLVMPIRFNFCGVYLEEIAVMEHMPPGTSGLIGQDILQRFSIVEFNNRERTITLIP